LKKERVTQSTQSLPDNYQPVYIINLAKNKLLAVVLNLAALFVVLLSFWLLGIFTKWIHPDLSRTIISVKFGLSEIIFLLFLVVLNLVVHELIHGVFFWLITRSKPVFGLSLSYAFAAAPHWYIPKRFYWIIGLAPLILISLIGLLIIAIGPPSWMLPALVVTGFNTGGAVGDIWIIFRLLRTSSTSLVNDTGHTVSFFQPK
jgi:hypothetical protein